MHASCDIRTGLWDKGRVARLYCPDGIHVQQRQADAMPLHTASQPPTGRSSARVCEANSSSFTWFSLWTQVILLAESKQHQALSFCRFSQPGPWSPGA